MCFSKSLHGGEKQPEASKICGCCLLFQYVFSVLVMPIVCFRIFGSLKKFRKYAICAPRVSHSGGAPSPLPCPMIILNPPPLSKLMPPMWYPDPVLQLENNSLSPNFPLKSKAPFQERIPRKKTSKIRKLSLLPVFLSQNNIGKRWQKFHKNVISHLAY